MSCDAQNSKAGVMVREHEADLVQALLDGGLADAGRVCSTNAQMKGNVR